jgi:hypothetical protein
LNRGRDGAALEVSQNSRIIGRGHECY